MPRRAKRLVLAGLALAAWSTHVLVMRLVYGGAVHEILWACHLAPVMLALGCLLDRVRLTSIATSWMALGAPLWLGNLVAAGELPGPTPALVHGGALALGIASVRTMGWERGTWWRASLALLVLAGVTRLVPAAERHNVNLVFRVWDGLEPAFPSFAAFFAFVTTSIPVTLYVLDRVFERIAPEVHGPPRAGHRPARTGSRGGSARAEVPMT